MDDVSDIKKERTHTHTQTADTQSNGVRIRLNADVIIYAWLNALFLALICPKVFYSALRGAYAQGTQVLISKQLPSN